MKRHLVKFVVISVWLIFGASFFVFNIVESENITRENYHEWISESYDFRFGEEKPFTPGNATTYHGKFIPGEDFISSARCAACHTDVHPQWAESAHAKSFVEPFYQRNVNDLIGQKNIAFTRHCESCHNPAALFSGALTDKPKFKERPFDEEGVSCIVCHSIEKVSGRGIGGYTLGQPALIEEADGTKIVQASDDDIFNNIDGHKRAMMRDLLKKPEFCASCHKSQVPQELNDYKFLRAFMVGDEHQQSSFSKEVPHPFYTRDKETCNSCHMERVPTRNYDVSVKEEKITDHRFAAANTAIPLVYGYKEQFEKVVEFLQDDKVRIDIFALHQQENRRDKAKLIAPLNRQTFKIDAGDTITADVLITNKNIGHSFPPELRDFYEAYIEFSVLDAGDRTLYKSGYIKKDGTLDDKAHNYKTYLVKGDGSFNDVHHIWQTKVVAYNNAIGSGRSDMSRYRFVIPNGYTGEIKLNAKVQYRRFTRVYSDYVIGKPTDYPIVTMSEVEESFNVGEKTKTREGRVKPPEMPDWWRWNNYGIALLDQRQYPQSADAFDEVIGFKNEYRPVAYTNKALALMQLGGWKEADKLIDKTLEMQKENYRAIFQQGRIFRVFSKLTEAEANFKQVLEKYPNDRMTLQQLGELAKIKSESVPAAQRDEQLKIAQAYYEKILSIDPEDLSSIYNLMLIYQKLKLTDKARDKAKQFRDLKDDPQTASLANAFLQKNWDVGNESLPYHTHDLIPFQEVWEKDNYLTAADIDWKNVKYYNPIYDVTKVQKQVPATYDD
jgi:tetratricopeptide (TPR) repeat protein/nitrate/TMAO reductase-like tetraheme cytochrome c subunit